jgi:hypothetical protein
MKTFSWPFGRFCLWGLKAGSCVPTVQMSVTHLDAKK